MKLDDRVIWSELEAILLKVDRFIMSDPALCQHTGRTVGALLVLAGGMMSQSDDDSVSFEDCVKHALVLLRVGFEHQRAAAKEPIQ